MKMGVLMIRILLTGAAALLTANCATAVRGTTGDVQFVSDPPEAEVRTSLGQSCVTPCTLKVERKQGFAATFEKPGYAPETVTVRTEVKGSGGVALAGNILVGGIIGAGVDAATGAALDHVPNPVSVALEPERRPPPPATRPRRSRGEPVS